MVRVYVQKMCARTVCGAYVDMKTHVRNECEVQSFSYATKLERAPVLRTPNKNFQRIESLPSINLYEKIGKLLRCFFTYVMDVSPTPFKIAPVSFSGRQKKQGQRVDFLPSFLPSFHKSAQKGCSGFFFRLCDGSQPP